jgi:tetratricopeptide (TPR) repeat protein
MSVDWNIGDCFYCIEHNQYAVYHLLAHENETFYALSFWPIATIPTSNDWDAFVVRTHCTTISKEHFHTRITFFNREITPKEKDELEQFKRIRAGKLLRETEFKRLLLAADEAMNQSKWQEAIDLLTEAAPFDKLNEVVYLNRGKCWMHLGNRLAALNDLNYVVQQNPSNANALELVALL